MSTAIVSNACPTFFRAWCRDAAEPGSEGFGLVGRQLAGHLIGLTPNDHEDEAWHEEMTRFQEILDAEDDEAALRWFDGHLPRCMALVPDDQRAAFLEGFRLALSEDEVDITLA